MQARQVPGSRVWENPSGRAGKFVANVCAKNRTRAWKRRYEMDPEKIKDMPPPPMSYDEWERRSNGEHIVQSSATSCDSIPPGMRGGGATTKKKLKAESDALVKAAEACHSLLASLIVLKEAPAMSGSKKGEQKDREKEDASGGQKGN